MAYKKFVAVSENHYVHIDAIEEFSAVAVKDGEDTIVKMRNGDIFTLGDCPIRNFIVKLYS